MTSYSDYRPDRRFQPTLALSPDGTRVAYADNASGQYDLVVISEAADEKVATAFALAQAGQGNARSTTLRAFDPTEFEAIVQLMP